MRDEIINHCAWMLWELAFVSWAEEDEARPDPGAGGSWDPLVPEVPNNVHEAAVKLIEAIERLNGATIDVLYDRAAAMPGKHYKKPTPERFGNCLGYMATRSGISWADDHPDPKYRMAYVEAHTFDGMTAAIEWSYYE